MFNLLAVSPGQTSSISDDTEVVTIIGSCQDAANQIKNKDFEVLNSYFCINIAWLNDKFHGVYLEFVKLFLCFKSYGSFDFVTQE